MGKEQVRHPRDDRLALDEPRLRRLLDATAEIARTVGDETRLDPVAKAIVDQARALVDSRALIMLLEDGGTLRLVAASGAVSSAGDARQPTDGAPWRHAITGRRAERLDLIPQRLSFAIAAFGIEARAALLVPLIARNRSIGLIAAFDRADGPGFGADDESLLSGLAASAAMAVATVQSMAEVRLRESIEVAERERARWARELHDDTLQGLGALRVRLATALRVGQPEQLAEVVGAAVVQIGDEIAALRSLITELRPAALDELGLGAAIESLVESRAGTDLEVHLELALAREDGVAVERLDREVESAVYRVIQEALTNVTKHAGADNVWIEVAEQPDAIAIVVRDDGIGFDMDDRGRGFGLVGMRERVALRGGSLTIVSAPTAGTELRGVIPLG
jgi:signal transduction histidine kinase